MNVVLQLYEILSEGIAQAKLMNITKSKRTNRNPTGMNRKATFFAHARWSRHNFDAKAVKDSINEPKCGTRI